MKNLTIEENKETLTDGVYSVPNPYFYSDRFVFCMHKDLGTVYIKLNSANEIEEIGIDIEKRMHTPLNQIKKLWDFHNANEIEEMLINHIGEEYWQYMHKIKILTN